MRLSFIAAVASLFAASAYTTAPAALPFSDDFESGVAAEWGTATAGTAFEQATNGSALTAVTSDTDWRGTTINPPAGGGTQFGKLTYDSPGFSTCWRLAGEDTDTNYVTEADIFVPVVDSDPEPDDFLYQMMLVSVNSDGYTRAHFQYNTSAGTPDPRMRVQTTYGGFQTPFNDTAVNIFGSAATEGWKNIVVEANHTANTITVTVDGTVLTGAAIGSLTTGYSTGGKFGFGMYVDGEDNPASNGINGQRSVYIDNFTAASLASVNDWAVYQ